MTLFFVRTVKTLHRNEGEKDGELSFEAGVCVINGKRCNLANQAI